MFYRIDSTCKPDGSICYRTVVLGERSLHRRNRHFAPVTLTLTFIYKLNRYCLVLQQMWKYELPMSRLLKVII